MGNAQILQLGCRLLTVRGYYLSKDEIITNNSVSKKVGGLEVLGGRSDRGLV